jgi:hypothetical protein
MRRLNIAEPDFAYDTDDPEGFRAGMLRFGKQLGAERSGTTVYEVPPGQAVCPITTSTARRNGCLSWSAIPRCAIRRALTASIRGTSCAFQPDRQAPMQSATRPIKQYECSCTRP